MKAEQRKELETNTLADKMGHMMQRVRGGQRRTYVTYFIVAIAVLAAAYFGYRWYVGDKVGRSLEWLMLYDGSRNHIEGLTDKMDTNAGKAAWLQIAWFRYWDDGIKLLAADKAMAMKNIESAGKIYEELAKTCKDDPVYEPQALLGLAVVEESLAVQARSHLDRAKTNYEALTDNEKYKDTAETNFARQRLEILNDPIKKNALADTYKDLQGRNMLDIPAPAPLIRGGFQGGDFGKGLP